MQWLSISLFWYVCLLALGIVFLPLTRLFFPHFIDRGYAFSKTVAILLLSYTVFLLGSIKVVPFARNSLFLIILVFTAINVYVFRKRSIKNQKENRKRELFFIIFEELLFLISFLFLVFVRGQE